MNGLQIPLPPGLAGASPSALGAAGDILGGAMNPGSQPWWYSSPDIMDFVASMAATGYDTAVAMEGLEYQAQRDDANRAQAWELANLELDAATKAANIAANASQAAASTYAAATTESARISAEAAMYAADQALAGAQERAEAARYAADQALAGVKIDAETRMKIAAGNLRLESQRVAAEEFGAPSDWIKQVGFLRGMDMTRADITPGAIQATGEMLGPGPPELGPVPQQAVVGEAGPELATATAQGVEVSPLDTQEAYWLRGQGVPGMQYGGRFSSAGPRQVTPKQQGINPADFGGPGQPGYDVMATMWAHEARNRARRGDLHPNLARRIQTGGRDYLQQAKTGVQQHYQQQAEQQMPAWFSQWLGAQGGAAAPGGQPGVPGAAPGGQPGAPAGAGGVAAGANEMPFLETQRTGAYVPLYEAWGGPTTLPEAGITDPVKMPHEYNYADFARWTPTEQQMMFATWQALGMEPTTALEIMRRSAPRGSAGAAVAYG